MIFPLPFVGVIVKLLSVQIAAVVFCMYGFGSTVTVTVNEAPLQIGEIPEAGVTVYVAV